MELEKERTQPTPNIPPNLKPFQQQPGPTQIPLSKNYSQEVSAVASMAVLIIGLTGFVVDNLFGAHLNPPHNTMHVFAGGLGLWCAFDSLKFAKRFNYIAGGIYTLLGALGFMLGQTGMPSLGQLTEDRFLWKLIPENLEWGAADHTIHLAFGISLLLGAIINVKSTKIIS